MNTRELLLDLQAELLRLWEAIPEKDRAPHGSWRHPWKIAIVYLEILILQEELGYHHRSEAVVQASWRCFLAAARHLNLFRKYEGNEAARRSLRDFLTSFPRRRNPAEQKRVPKLPTFQEEAAGFGTYEEQPRKALHPKSPADCTEKEWQEALRRLRD